MTFFAKIKTSTKYASLGFLVIGSCIGLGLLSFGGMWAILPSLYPAVASGLLAAAYEGEIYLQNIRSAFNKLLTRKYLKKHIAKGYLGEVFEKAFTEPGKDFDEDAFLENGDIPQFFKDYYYNIKVTQSNNYSKKDKKIAKRLLDEMDELFADRILINHSAPLSPYWQVVSTWVNRDKETQKKWFSNDTAELSRIDKWRSRLYVSRLFGPLVKFISLSAAAFMTVNMAHLIIEPLSLIRFLAPIITAPTLGVYIGLGVFIFSAGVAYGFLTYNALTDMLFNDSLRCWVSDMWAQEWSIHKVGMLFLAFALMVMTLTLTLCTAGTWWTIITETRAKGPALLKHFSKIPDLVIGWINTIVIGIATGAFNLSNIQTTHKMLFEQSFKKIKKQFTDAFASLRTRENWLQILNPFRFLTYLIFKVLVTVLFIGHIIGVMVTGDRMDNIPVGLALATAFLNEFFEDMHYFAHHWMIHNHDAVKSPTELLSDYFKNGGHNHNLDLPSAALLVGLSPLLIALLFCSTLFDWGTSKLNSGNGVDAPKSLSLWEAFEKHMKVETIWNFLTRKPKEATYEKFNKPGAWDKEYALFRVEEHLEERYADSYVTVNRLVKNEKQGALEGLKNDLRTEKDLNITLNAAKENITYQKHRSPLPSFFTKPKSQQLVEELVSRSSAAASA